MRSMWNGTISFGLVTIHVALYPATRRDELTFRLLRKSDQSPVNYKRVAQADGKEVKWENIVKGYEYEKGKFVILKPDDFKRVDLEAAAQTIDIMDFVEVKEINPMYFQKPYYLEPQKGGDKAYALLRDALRDSGKIGIAKVVIRTREHLAGVKAQGDAILLEIMHFGDELIDAASDLTLYVTQAKSELPRLSFVRESIWPGSKRRETPSFLRSCILAMN